MTGKTEKILIYGKTYPEISSRYIETVCTGGIRESDFSFIRLYPIPFRYLESGRQFKKYQWIRAKIKTHKNDQRPESYSVDLDSIEILDTVGTGRKRDWEDRKKYFLHPSNVFKSLEELRAKQEKDRTSIGMIKPKEIKEFFIKQKEEKDYIAATIKRDQVFSQPDMFREYLDHEIPKFKFFFRFVCDDSKCNGHEISVLDWEFYELYRRVRHEKDWCDKMKAQIMKYCDEGHDTYFFMGNLADPARRDVFCVSGLFYPPKSKQLNFL